jgi:hypothetical protein
LTAASTYSDIDLGFFARHAAKSDLGKRNFFIRKCWDQALILILFEGTDGIPGEAIVCLAAGIP